MTSLPPPLVLALLAFLAGLLPALRAAPPPDLLLAAALAVPCLAALVRRPSGRAGERAQALLLLLGFAAAGAALGAAGASDAATDCRTAIPDGERLGVEGVLHAGMRDGAPGRVFLPLEAGGACPRVLRVRPGDAGLDAPAGSVVRVSGEWVRQGGGAVRSAWPRDPLYAGFLTADSVALVSPPDGLAHPLLAARGHVEEVLRDLFPRHDALAGALLLNRREYMDPALRDRFARSGLAHLLAISGLHVALLAASMLLLGAVARLPRARVAGLTIAGTAAYLAVIGAPASAVRSGIMLSLALLALVLQRPSAALPIVSAAALAILALDPLAVLDPGFQLSFLGVLGVLFAHRALLPALPGAWRRHGASRHLVEGVAVSLAAFVATAPVTAYFFGQVAPVAILANLPAIPLSSLALVGVALAALTAPLAPPLARLLADGAGAALDALDRVATVAADLPHGHLAVPRPQVWLWLGTAAGLALAVHLSRRLRPRVRSAVAIGVACAVPLGWPALARGPAGVLEIHFLDVGQGDATVLRTPGGRWILIDAGPRAREYDAGERRVLPFLRTRGAARLDALVLTHPDADHVGGAAAVLAGIPVDRVVDPGLPAGKDLYVDVLRAAEARGVAWHEARPGSALRLDGVVLEFLWPEENLLDAAPEANQISAVMRLRYGQFSLLLTGDAPAAVERELARRDPGALRAQILKAGHHGSATSTSPELLDAAAPELVVVSVGRRNRYGHPAPEVLERLFRRGIAVARTDREGTVTLRVLPGAGGRWERVDP